MSVSDSSAMPAALTSFPNSGELPGGSWALQARGGIVLLVRWVLEEGGQRVQIDVEQQAGAGAPCRRQGQMGWRQDLRQRLSLAFGPPGREVLVDCSLVREERLDGTWERLWIDAPCSDTQFLHMELGCWRVEASPLPHAEPGPEPEPFPGGVIETPGLELFPSEVVEAIGGPAAKLR